MNIGKGIKIVRERKRIKQYEMAKAIDISKSRLSIIECGETPNATTLKKIEEYLDTPTILLLWYSLDASSARSGRGKLFIKLKPLIDGALECLYKAEESNFEDDPIN